MDRRAVVLGSLAAVSPIVALAASGSPTLRAAAERRGLLFGSCIQAAELGNASVREVYANHCNIVCAYNQQQWHMLERRERGRTQAIELIDFANANGQAIRWHSLLWGPTISRAARDDVISGDARALRDRIVSHIERTVSEFSQRVAVWDVVNEPFSDHNSSLERILGERYVMELVDVVQGLAPDSVKLINFDFAEETQRRTNRLIDFMRNWRIVSRNQIAIGLQSHIWPGRADSSRRLLQILDVARDLAFPVWISELHVNATEARCRAARCSAAELEAQAETAQRAFLSRVLEHAAVNAVMYWGLCDSTHFLNVSRLPPGLQRSDGLQTGYALFDRQLSLKPVGGWLLDRMAGSPSLRRNQ
jgi:endo-1,4-beta-xylanase